MRKFLHTIAFDSEYSSYTYSVKLVDNRYRLIIGSLHYLFICYYHKKPVLANLGVLVEHSSMVMEYEREHTFGNILVM